VLDKICMLVDYASRGRSVFAYSVSFITCVGNEIILNRVKLWLSVFKGTSRINLIPCALPTAVTLINS